MTVPDKTERNRDAVRRFYDVVWNRWDTAAAADVVAADVRFRGSLGSSLVGREGFLNYVEQVRTAFPDFHNQVDDLIVEDDTVVARLTCAGTHRGELFGIPPTGRRITYAAIAILRLDEGRIKDAWVVGDTQELWRALETAPPTTSREPPGRG